MTLKELKQKVLGLIEEYAPDEETKRLTADDDIENKMNDVINQVMYEICRMKKLPKFIEMEVNKGDLIDFAMLETECGYEIYQIRLVSGVDYDLKADGTILKMLESGTAEIDVFVYPEAITSKTKDSYEFELTTDVLEIMPYGIAADLLATDVTGINKEFRERFETMLSRLDPRNHMPSISIVGGYDI
jgi:hypothetical protein